MDSDGAGPDDDEYDRLDYIQSVLDTGSESTSTSGYSPEFPPPKKLFLFAPQSSAHRITPHQGSLLFPKNEFFINLIFEVGVFL